MDGITALYSCSQQPPCLCDGRIGSLLANCAIKMSTKANNKEIKPKINVKRMNSNGNKNKERLLKVNEHPVDDK